MNRDNIIITASHINSLPTQILVEFLRRKDIKIHSVITVSIFQGKRIKRILKNYDFAYLINKVKEAIFSNQKFNKNLLLKDLANDMNFTPNGLKKWCKKYKVNLLTVNDINSDKSINYIKKINNRIILYSGGGIFKKNFLKECKIIINAHAGPLPEIRGINAAEWSLITNCRSEITVHFINEGIDTGDIIKSYLYDRSKCKNISNLREKAIITGIKGLVDVIENKLYKKIKIKKIIKPANLSKQYYAMSPLLKNFIDSKISKRLCS